WISHFHLDHCGGLAPLLFSMKHAPETRSRSKPLRIFGPSRLRSLLDSFNDASDYRLFDQRFPIEIFEIESLETFSILDGVTAVPLKTPHTPESHAIHLRDSSGGTLAFTADTGYDLEIAAFARRVDLLLIECSFVRNKPVERHLELVEAIDLIRRADPVRAVLTHLYPEWDKIVLKEVTAEYSTKAEIELAYDGYTWRSQKEAANS
ncbi:MAG TPA: MBL fold metallo-hydrolase, partial [Pyrinomonadaceae bacterium]|nr:MBL fold metallo-hydrolase [Pyrinomonadaceae bacterium]